MKLRVTPIYGWGWFKGETAVEVPPPFEFDVTITQTGDPFTSVLGQVPTGHPLAGKWLILTPRRKSFSLGFDGVCNLFGFNTKPIVPKINEALTDPVEISGFVQLDEIID